MKFIVLGTTEFTLRCAQALLDSGAELRLLVSMPERSRPINSADVSGFAQSHKILYHETEDINSPESLSAIKKQQADYILASWPAIIKREVLGAARMCIGSHPTDLPHNRGRHPLHWLITLGFKESKLSFFRMNEGIDSGNILLKIPFRIGKKDSIMEVVAELNDAAYKGTKGLYRLLKRSVPEGTEQEHKEANYWRKRSVHDVILDLRMPSDTIIRTVRSFSTPYPCAKLIFEDSIIAVSKAEVAQTPLSKEEIMRTEPGKIISAEGKRMLVKSEDKIMLLETDGLPQKILEAKYIHPPSKYIAGWSQNQLKRLEN